MQTIRYEAAKAIISDIKNTNMKLTPARNSILILISSFILALFSVFYLIAPNIIFIFANLTILAVLVVSLIYKQTYYSDNLSKNPLKLIPPDYLPAFNLIKKLNKYDAVNLKYVCERLELEHFDKISFSKNITSVLTIGIVSCMLFMIFECLITHPNKVWIGLFGVCPSMLIIKFEIYTRKSQIEKLLIALLRKVINNKNKTFIQKCS